MPESVKARQHAKVARPGSAEGEKAGRAPPPPPPPGPGSRSESRSRSRATGRGGRPGREPVREPAREVIMRTPSRRGTVARFPRGGSRCRSPRRSPGRAAHGRRRDRVGGWPRSEPYRSRRWWTASTTRGPSNSSPTADSWSPYATPSTSTSWTTNGSVSDPVPGTPETFTVGQGGLMIVAAGSGTSPTNGLDLPYLGDCRGRVALPQPWGGARGPVTPSKDSRRSSVRSPSSTAPTTSGNRIVFGPEGPPLPGAGGGASQFGPRAGPHQPPGDHHPPPPRRLCAGGTNPFVGRSRNKKGKKNGLGPPGRSGRTATAGTSRRRPIHPESGELWVGEMGALGWDE